MLVTVCRPSLFPPRSIYSHNLPRPDTVTDVSNVGYSQSLIDHRQGKTTGETTIIIIPGVSRWSKKLNLTILNWVDTSIEKDIVSVHETKFCDILFFCISKDILKFLSPSLWYLSDIKVSSGLGQVNGGHGLKYLHFPTQSTSLTWSIDSIEFSDFSAQPLSHYY